MKGHFFHREELEKILDEALNETLGEVNKNNVFDKTITNTKITGIAGWIYVNKVDTFFRTIKQLFFLPLFHIHLELNN
ncbi:MAG: hypothetical protein E7212_15085 [Clostridium sartagoforme]|nr:hypothetical protein [Clostridium sartagoforme]